MQKITSLQHPLVKHLVKLRQNRRYRYDNGTVLVEGRKILSELPFPCKTILVQDEALVFPAEETYLVPKEIIEKVSGAKAPEGVVGEVALPKNRSLTGMTHLIALDGVSDPGNLGTLLRTALALNWQGVFLLENCCDPFNDKAIRAAKGATFRLPLCQGNWQDFEELIKEHTPLLADLGGGSLDDLPSFERPLLILGSEAHGPSDRAKALAQKVTIPLHNHVDSLNVAVAGAILMYAMRPL